MSASDYPEDVLYHPEHDWARVEPGSAAATIGITWYAQDTLGEVVHLDPPTVGAQVRQGDPYAEIESVKAVSDVIAPLSGEVVEVNDAVVSEPDLVNRDPYGAGWLARIRLADRDETSALLSSTAYQELL